MICNYCGNNIPDGSAVCPYCQKPAGGMGYPGSPQYQSVRTGNIFSALVYEKTPGVIWEFSLWCVVCVCVLLSLVATVSVSSWMSGENYFRFIWLYLMTSEIMIGFFMAVRKKPEAMSATAGAVQFLMPVILFAAYGRAFDQIKGSIPVVMILLFVLVLLAALGLLVCSFIQFHSSAYMGNVVAILDAAVTGANLLFIIGIGASSDYISGWVISKSGFGPGAVSLVCFTIVMAVYSMLFFFGCIDSSIDKITSGIKLFTAGGSGQGKTNKGNSGGENFSGGAGQIPGFEPGVQCIRGQYQGQVMYLKGQELTFGSQAGAADIVIVNPYISHRHCSIRYNLHLGMYEILDISTNGVYIVAPNVGMNRIPAGQYIPCHRGSVVSLGGMEQQFRLL
ncbi:MAG: FHA domain-containing protein [Eubacterium sp.]|nr:FHA domain-containing protein [Eubacterium sp.]